MSAPTSQRGASGLALSAVLPCFEEADGLERVVDGLARALVAARDAGQVGWWEIVLVASEAARDGTPDLARKLATERPEIRVALQPRDDPGYGRAVALGFSHAKNPWALLTDADGQFDHTELPRLLALAPDAEAVVGYRERRADAAPRRLAGRLHTAVSRRVLGLPPLRDLDCAFKLVHTAAVGSTPLRSRTGMINAEILSRVAASGGRIAQVGVSHRPRAAGHARFETALGLPRPSEALALARDLAALAALRVRAHANAAR